MNVKMYEAVKIIVAVLYRIKITCELTIDADRWKNKPNSSDTWESLKTQFINEQRIVRADACDGQAGKVP